MKNVEEMGRRTVIGSFTENMTQKAFYLFDEQINMESCRDLSVNGLEVMTAFCVLYSWMQSTGADTNSIQFIQKKKQKGGHI